MKLKASENSVSKTVWILSLCQSKNGTKCDKIKKKKNWIESKITLESLLNPLRIDFSNFLGNSV